MALHVDISNTNGVYQQADETGDTEEILISFMKRVKLRLMLLARDQSELAPWTATVTGTCGTCPVCEEPLTVNTTFRG